MKTQKVLSMIVFGLFLLGCSIVGSCETAPVWTVRKSDVADYSFEYRYKTCSVDVRKDGRGVIISAIHYGDGETIYLSKTLHVTQDGVYSSHGNSSITHDGMVISGAGYDVFYADCLEAAKRSLPESAKIAFRGYYGLGEEKQTEQIPDAKWSIWLWLTTGNKYGNPESWPEGPTCCSVE